MTMQRAATGKHVRANGIRQHYLHCEGVGPAVVIVPGIITPAILWAFVGERLSRQFDVYILDVRGRGLSEAGPHLRYTIDDCAADVVSFAAKLRLATYTLIGHSLGARIGVRVARLAPTSIEHLVLLDPPVTGPGRRSYPTKLETILALLLAARRGEAEVSLRADPRSATWPEPLLRLRAEWLHTCEEQAVREGYADFHASELHADLERLAVPTSLIAAGKGGVITEDDEAEILRLNPAIRFQRVASAGHQLQVDDPDGFFRSLGTALGKVV